jgi:hypothetical protein
VEVSDSPVVDDITDDVMHSINTVLLQVVSGAVIGVLARDVAAWYHPMPS